MNRSLAGSRGIVNSQLDYVMQTVDRSSRFCYAPLVNEAKALVNISAKEARMVDKSINLLELKAGGRMTVSVEEAALILGISLGSARKAVRGGELPALRLGSRWLVPLPRLLQILGIDEKSES
jgi:excisionase family DNA binding protein